MPCRYQKSQAENSPGVRYCAFDPVLGELIQWLIPKVEVDLMVNDEASEQVRVRREKLERLRASEYPYPNDVKLSATCAEAWNAANGLPAGGQTSGSYCVAGRILSFRLMGKAAFFHIQDRSGRVQVYVKQADIGEELFDEFKSLDLGDIVEVSGFGFLTKTGEPSLHAKTVRLLVKCLHPLPEKWHGLTDVEVRYRRRYVDLIVNPEVRETFKRRAQIISGVRRFFDARDYVEVETPVLHHVASGAAARPFVTHHNALDLRLDMRIALELHLKRLVVGGLERVYEIGRVFRNEGISTRHNPEFTMLEFYCAYETYETLMDLTEEFFLELAETICGSSTVEYQGKQISFERPWPRLDMKEAVYRIGGIDRRFPLHTLEGVKAAAATVGLDHISEATDQGEALFELYDTYVEERIVNPTFITGHPTSVSPLSRPSMSDPSITDRFELVVAGMELANGFSELNDPDDQRARFEAQMAAKAKGQDEVVRLDEDFVRALEYGMPPTAGQGVGIDRLTMLLTGSPSIRDVILFPLMRLVANE
jgi:lysyl-tRNA synthetase class 2